MTVFSPSLCSLCLRSLFFLLFFALCQPVWALDQATVRRGGKTLEATGKVLITAQDGGIALLATDGVLWLIPPEEIVKHQRDDAPFVPLDRDALSRRVLAELPEGFQVYSTTHYLIFYDTSKAYAQWCGLLFEQLYRAFTNFWSRKGVELVEPEFPLVAVVFADKKAYLDYSRPELGEAGESVIGYFGLLTNRMTMYDLTGLESQGRGRVGTTAQVNQILSQPEALRTVATIVHEATHQLAYNCGIHPRMSDCPRWFSEGIAMFFETPDLRGGMKKGWAGIGSVNRSRLDDFQKYLAARPANSLETLIRDDRRFSDPKQMLDAYAEAWSLTYFLLKKHEKKYVDYLRLLSKKKPLLRDAPQQRVDDFRRVFGELEAVDAEFLRYMTRGR